MYENLKYSIEESTIANLLGVQNFTNKESAILELVKNSFDAQAEVLKIYFERNKLIIEDDGIGMSINDIKKKWMHIGKSSKGYFEYDRKSQKRVLSGSKGVGRFALARLGKEIYIYSKKNNENSILWKTNWEESLLEEVKNENKIGTKIIIKNLRDVWNEFNIKKLWRYLARTYNSNLMKIYLYYGDNVLEVENYFSELNLGINCLSQIKLLYNSKKRTLECMINSDEFRKEAQSYCKNLSINNFSKEINIFDELKNNKELNLSDKELNDKLKSLGAFSGEFYFILKSKKKDMDRFMYKERDTSEFYESGVILYRNSFSISSYDGSKDWIGFSKRARKSPATAIHPSGNWRVRDNNIAGKVEIDKEKNQMLMDLSNRQGIEENDYYEIFLLILDKGLSIFEKYRQSIIREINKKNDIKETYEENIIKKFFDNPEKVKDMNSSEIITLRDNVQKIVVNIEKLKVKMVDMEEKFNYDFRILNTLSTSGLKATSVAHDLENYNNFIATSSENLIKALKACNVWDIVNEPENNKIENRSVPKLIEKNKEINKKISQFMSSILEESKKSKFMKKEINILEFLNKLKVEWERDYSRLRINIKLIKDIILITAEDLLKVIFDNLILNSFQQNKDMNTIKIDIEIKKEDNKLKIIYRDYGRGLDKKYLSDPYRILDVHETTRLDGHGLGMWIVNNTIKFGMGNIFNICNHSKGGFEIEFTFGEF